MGYYVEAFRSEKPVCRQKFFIYKLELTEVPPDYDGFSLLRSCCRYLNHRYYQTIYFAGTDDKYIYTTNRLTEKMLAFTGTGNNNQPLKGILRLITYELLDFSHKAVYESYIYKTIVDKLRTCRLNNQSKYYVMDGKVYTDFIYNDTKNNYQLLYTDDREIQLSRHYDFKVHLNNAGYFFLALNSHSLFKANFTIYDLHKKQSNLTNLHVKYWLNASFSQSGYIVDAPENANYSTKESLIAYYQEKYSYNKRLMKIIALSANDDIVVFVKNNQGKILSYLGRHLRPIITLDYVERKSPYFSKLCSHFLKRNMTSRIKEDMLFLSDIGNLTSLASGEIRKQPLTAASLGYNEIMLNAPTLKIGQNREITAVNPAKKNIFKPGYGYYYLPPYPDGIKLAFLYGEGRDEEKIAKHCLLYALAPKYFNLSQLYPAVMMDKMHIRFFPYDAQNFTATSLKIKADEVYNDFKPDIAIIITASRHSEVQYDSFKKEFALHHVPAQMISQQTERAMAQKNAPWKMENIAMGILGKLGAVPYVLRDIPGGTDLFIGIDVGMAEKNIHYPSCAAAFGKMGELLGIYQTPIAQKGEKIAEPVLNDLLDNIILAYQQKYNHKPGSVVIHRDGFSAESTSWYEKYFSQNKINYSLIEIRKQTTLRLTKRTPSLFVNPDIGEVIYKENEAIIITTGEGNQPGAPLPLKIVKITGDLDILTLANQVYSLTKIYAGSPGNIRLPITTYYADKTCKFLNYLPKGEILNKLYFL